MNIVGKLIVNFEAQGLRSENDEYNMSMLFYYTPRNLISLSNTHTSLSLSAALYMCGEQWNNNSLKLMRKQQTILYLTKKKNNSVFDSNFAPKSLATNAYLQTLVSFSIQNIFKLNHFIPPLIIGYIPPEMGPTRTRTTLPRVPFTMLPHSDQYQIIN